MKKRDKMKNKILSSSYGTYGVKMEHSNVDLEVILALLKYKKLHVRGISRIINQPHANISRLMKRLSKNSVVEFKFEGKNKVFQLRRGIESLNHVYMAEHFKLLRLFVKYPFLSIIIDSILSKTNQKLIIIFGSHAKNIAKKNSDIDIFIETLNRKVKTEIENINSRLNVKIGKFDKNNLLIREIIKDHVIIKGVEYYYEKNKIFD